MSTPAAPANECKPCSLGIHEAHQPETGCECTGDCAERYDAKNEAETNAILDGPSQ